MKISISSCVSKNPDFEFFFLKILKYLWKSHIFKFLVKISTYWWKSHISKFLAKNYKFSQFGLFGEKFWGTFLAICITKTFRKTAKSNSKNCDFFYFKYSTQIFKKPFRNNRVRFFNSCTDLWCIFVALRINWSISTRNRVCFREGPHLGIGPS